MSDGLNVFGCFVADDCLPPTCQQKLHVSISQHASEVRTESELQVSVPNSANNRAHM